MSSGRAISPTLSSSKSDFLGAASRQRCHACRRMRSPETSCAMDRNRNTCVAPCAECVADRSASCGFAIEAKPGGSVRWIHAFLLLRVSDICSASACSSDDAQPKRPPAPLASAQKPRALTGAYCAFGFRRSSEWPAMPANVIVCNDPHTPARHAPARIVRRTFGLCSFCLPISRASVLRKDMRPSAR